MATTSMQLDRELRDELAKIAEQDFGGVPLGEAVRRLVREHQINRIMQRYEELRADPEEWASYQDESRLVDNTVGDGLPGACGVPGVSAVSPAGRSPKLAPWQVWLVDFGQPIGHEQGGRRPAVVVGSSTHCRFPIGMALVVPLTTRDRRLDHHIRIDSAESGLDRPSWARTEEIAAVSTQRFGQSAPLGIASDPEIAELSAWLREMVAFS